MYALFWLNMKLKLSCIYRSKRLKKLDSYINLTLKNVTDSVIHRNAYFAAPENVFLCMLPDDRRELALLRIVKARAGNEGGIRKYLFPSIHFGVTGILIRFNDMMLNLQNLLRRCIFLITN